MISTRLKFEKQQIEELKKPNINFRKFIVLKKKP